MQQQTKILAFRFVRFLAAMAAFGFAIAALFHFFAVMFNTVLTPEDLVAMYRHRGFWMFTLAILACLSWLVKKWANRKVIETLRRESNAAFSS